MSSGSDKSSDRADVGDVAAWRAFLLAHAAVVRVIDADVQRTGIPLTWYDVLLELDAAESRRLRMQELSDRVVLSRTRVSRVVDEMVGRGLVSKQPDDGDRRSTWAVITPEGRAALERTAPAYMAGIQNHFNRYLTQTERRVLARALTKVANAHTGGEAVTGPQRRRGASTTG